MKMQKLYINEMIVGGLSNPTSPEKETKILPYISFVQPLEGQYTIACDGGTTYRILPGEMFIAPSGAVQEICHINDETTRRMTARWIFFDAVVDNVFRLEQVFSFPVHITKEIAPSSLLDMDCFFEADSFCGRMSILYRMVDTLLSLSEEKDNKIDEKMQLLAVYMQKNYHLPLTIEDLSQYTALSESYLYARFKQAFGVSPIHYLNELRLQAAAGLLLSSKLTLAEIAEQIGLCDAYYLSKLFKKTYGVSPRDYRKQNAF